MAAERLRQALAAPIAVDGTAHSVAASIGVATLAADEPLHGRDLLARADRDMYDDKQRTAAAAARRPIVGRRGQ